MTYKPTEDVNLFIDRCSAIVGNYSKNQFAGDQGCVHIDLKIESPIEHIFYSAFSTLMKINYCSGCEPIETKSGTVCLGINILPQYLIKNYRVDFFIQKYLMAEKPIRELIVECDSQIFHERTEMERRYEKKRDRIFQLSGYKVFHFTGAEIKKEPFAVAAEVLSFIEDCPIETILEGLDGLD